MRCHLSTAPAADGIGSARHVTGHGLDPVHDLAMETPVAVRVGQGYPALGEIRSCDQGRQPPPFPSNTRLHVRFRLVLPPQHRQRDQALVSEELRPPRRTVQRSANTTDPLSLAGSTEHSSTALPREAVVQPKAAYLQTSNKTELAHHPSRMCSLRIDLSISNPILFQIQPKLCSTTRHAVLGPAETVRLSTLPSQLSPGSAHRLGAVRARRTAVLGRNGPASQRPGFAGPGPPAGRRRRRCGVLCRDKRPPRRAGGGAPSHISFQRA